MSDLSKDIHIMLIDDNDFDKQIFMRVLQKTNMNYHVTAFDRAEDALEELDDDSSKYDLIVTDQNLVGMSGMEFSIEVFRRQITVPIIMLTGAGSEHLAVASLKIGVEDYIVKDLNQGYVELLPIVIPKIIQKYEDRLARSTAERELKNYTFILEQTNREKEKALSQLKEVSETKNRFLGMASHDLKSPISIIIGFVNLMRDGIEGPVTPSQEDCLSRIHSQCKYMQMLLDDLLSVSALESGKLEYNPHVHSPIKVMRNTYDSIMIRAKDKDIRLVWEVPEELPKFNFDDNRLSQVFSNLLSNSVKFCRGGDWIKFCANVRDQDLEISIADTGPGIPEEELSKLFVAFQQLSTKATSGEKGSGLGLSITKEIVALHGGSIEVETSLGQGTTFYLRFPLKPEEGKIVLWVDDEEDLCKLAEKIVLSQLKNKVKEVVIASDGSEALAVLSAKHVDLVVSDILMPQINGIELLEIVRKRFPILPVILMTAYQDRFDARDSLSKGAAGYFTKPFNIDEMRSAIDRSLSNADSRAIE